MIERIILASSSPQRTEILKRLGVPFIAVPPNCEESTLDKGCPLELASANAEKKLISVLNILQEEKAQGRENEALKVLSCDTVVALEGRIFCKPKSREEAAAMLAAFSGKTHQVVTAISFFNGKTGQTSARASRTEVAFMELSAAQIERYLDAGEWQGAAGGYRIQGLAACFIEGITGSHSGAVGLPVHLLYKLLLENDCGFIV